jgi:hypothetical protein
MYFICVGGQKVIVVFKNDAPEGVISSMIENVKNEGGSVEHRYDMRDRNGKPTFQGFAGTVPESLLTSLQGHAHIDYIEADQEVRIQ